MFLLFNLLGWASVELGLSDAIVAGVIFLDKVICTLAPFIQFL